MHSNRFGDWVSSVHANFIPQLEDYLLLCFDSIQCNGHKMLKLLSQLQQVDFPFRKKFVLSNVSYCKKKDFM